MPETPLIPALLFTGPARTLTDRRTGGVVAADVSASHAALFAFAPQLFEHAKTLGLHEIAGQRWGDAHDALQDTVAAIEAYPVATTGAAPQRAPRSPLDTFLNAFKILRSIDRHELVNASLDCMNDDRDWVAFREKPLDYLIRADDERRAAIWSIVEQRQR